MSDWIEKAKDFVKGHPEQAKQGLDKVEDLLNERTGGKYADQIDQGSDKLKESLGLPPDEEATIPPAPSPSPEPGPSEIPPTGEPAGEQDLPGVPNPDEPATGSDHITLGDPPPNQH